MSGFLVSILTVSLPPLSQEYVLAKKAEADAKQKGQAIRIDFSKISKFEPGWRLKDPLTYIQIAMGIATLYCFIGAHREGKKMKSQQAAAAYGVNAAAEP